MESIESEKSYGRLIKTEDEWLEKVRHQIEDSKLYIDGLSTTKTDKVSNIDELEQAIRGLVKSGKHDIQIFFDNYSKKLDNEKKFIDEYMED